MLDFQTKGNNAAAERAPDEFIKKPERSFVLLQLNGALFAGRAYGVGAPP